MSKTDAGCGHPNHGAADHNCAPFTDAPRVYRVERDGRRGDLREFVAGHLDVTDPVADDLLRAAAENGLPLDPIPCDLPNVTTFVTAQVLPVLTADGWRVTQVDA